MKGNYLVLRDAGSLPVAGTRQPPAGVLTQRNIDIVDFVDCIYDIDIVDMI